MVAIEETLLDITYTALLTGDHKNIYITDNKKTTFDEGSFDGIFVKVKEIGQFSIIEQSLSSISLQSSVLHITSAFIWCTDLACSNAPGYAKHRFHCDLLLNTDLIKLKTMSNKNA